MRSLWLGILLATVESLAFGQLDGDTLRVAVSRSINPQPDQIVFSISLNAPATTGLDGVLASLKDTGITSANLSNVFSVPGQDSLNWVFSLPVPFSKISATAAQLTAKKVTFSVQSSVASTSPQCPVSNLMADAKTNAKRLADAAELVVGEVLTLSSGDPLITTSPVAIPTAVQRNVDPIAAIPVLLPYVARLVPVQPAVRASCSLVVKFQLLRYHY